MKWHKVNMRKADKNLPPTGIRVLWAKPRSDREGFWYFFGYIDILGNIDTGFEGEKPKTNYYWCYTEDIKNPTSEETSNIISEKIKECARQEDAPIYRGDEEVDYFVRLSEVLEILEEPLS